jgi:GNAT superfamily N-acetyltransferase
MSEPVTAPAGVYALLADGRTVEIRPAMPADFAAVKAMHEAMSPGNSYLRFFSLSRLAAEQEARRVTREPGPGHAALLALYDGQIVGLASFEVTRDGAGRPGGGRTAEVAFAVADTMHHRGIATLLLEHLVSLARARPLEALTAETLQENTGMLRVFSDAGLPVVSKREDGVVAITIPLPPDDDGRQLEAYLETVAARERSANVASLRPVFAPRSVAASPASPMSRACRSRRTSRSSPSRRSRSSTPPRRADGAGCAASSCSLPPSTRRSVPTCSPRAAGTGCG